MIKRNKKGFTLAELLIVVAIIAVLVAIAIPIFTKQLEKSREAYDIDTMRQAASLAVEYYYTYPSDQDYSKDPDGKITGLKWWKNNNGDQANAAGVYDPAEGKFRAMSSGQITESMAYGKGTSTNTGVRYTYNSDREIYASDQDYTKAVVMVAIYPIKNKHIDVYWKNAGTNGKTGSYVGGQNGKNQNDPKYSIRIPLE